MLNLIQRFFNKAQYDKTLARKNFTEFFFAQAEHAWISDSPAREHFEKLFQILPAGVLQVMTTKYPMVFVQSSSFVNKPSRLNTIVVFPEFQKLLQSPKRSAVAYLAHEIAFVLFELEEPAGPTLMAEIEADKFVCDLGLTFELEEFLLMLDETVEKRLRMTYLTSHHFNSN